MLQNRGLASKETGGTGAGLQECHLKAQKQSIVRRGYGGDAGGGATQMNYTDLKLKQH